MAWHEKLNSGQHDEHLTRGVEAERNLNSPSIDSRIDSNRYSSVGEGEGRDVLGWRDRRRAEMLMS